MDAIDITDLVEKTRSTFVDWATLYLFGLEVAVPGLEWVGLPIIQDIDKEIIREILNALSKAAVMQAFFMNTALRKASEAQDFVEAVDLIFSLPEDVSDDVYAKAEAAQMAAFRDFVSVGN